jgi:sigma-B regulation protein RsbU (phosphoserine phosphatase)
LVLGLQIDDRGLFERLLEEVTVPLGAGDVFMLYTDGVTEAMSPEGDFFGEDRLSALVQLHARGPFTELRTQVLDAVTTFVGASEQQDDITMLVLQIEAVPVAA